jgi:ParB-like chromosome segregation protein Spo0J
MRCSRIKEVSTVATRKIETVTPSMARLWLNKNMEKTLDIEKLYDYIDAIKEGRWYPEEHRASPIMFHGGRLLNGHHRLMAIIILDYGVEMYVEVK